jgi:hypothetical protein
MRYSKNMGKCVGCAFIFSGRPDPTWRVKEELAQSLEAIWDELEPTAEQEPQRPKLGYRGCSIQCTPDKEYTAYKGIVTKQVGNITESRKDETKRFEELLLATAPKGILPENLSDT